MPRKEWACPQCAVSTWASRTVCRRCMHSAQKAAPPEVTPRPPRSWASGATLGAVAQAAASAGASADTVSVLRKEATAQRAERRTPGGRLDAARAKVGRTARVAAEARAAAAAAAAKAEEAFKQAAVAADELAAVEAELAAQPPQPHKDEAPQDVAAILQDVRLLLAALEQAPVPGHVGNGPALPASALQSVAALRARLDAPPRAAALSEALEPSGPSSVADPSGAESDSLMGELAGLEDSDEEGLLDVARRLKKARHSGP